MSRAALILSILLLLPSCDRSKLDEAKWKAVGAETVLPFKKGLKQALIEGLEGGPVEAVAACRVEAPKLAAAHGLGAVNVGRASRKLRNPTNAAKLWMLPFLEVYENDPERREPGVVVIDDETVGYVEPIFVQPLCVTCHGAELDPNLEARVKELYPDDQATGYAAGDFRGVFWAELPR